MSPSPPSDSGSDVGGDAEVGEVSNELPDEPEAKGPLKPVGEYSLVEIIALIVGMAEFGLALTMMIMSQITSGPPVRQIALIGGILAMLLGPYVYWQRCRLKDIRTFKEVQEALENQVKGLKKSVESLGKSLEDLTETNEQLAMVKETFDKLSAMGGESIEEFEKSVARQRENVLNHGESLKGELVRFMAEVIEEADADGDAIFDEDEVEVFIERLKEMEGLIIFEDRIRDRMINAPMDVAEQMLMELHDDEAPPDQILFDITAA